MVSFSGWFVIKIIFSIRYSPPCEGILRQFFMLTVNPFFALGSHDSEMQAKIFFLLDEQTTFRILKGIIYQSMIVNEICRNQSVKILIFL